MGKRILAALLSFALVPAIAGCGGGGENASANPDAASALLLEAGDLPAEVKTIDGLENGPCNPLEVLKSSETSSAKSPMFVISRVRIQEAVGVFAGDDPAAAAYDALNAESRLSCIRGVVGLQGLSAKVLSQRDFNAGDEARTVQFEVRRSDSEPQGFEIASIRSGESVASLIFLNTTGESSRALVDDAIRSAADRLAGESGS
jgi:hypothetical protein